MALQDELPSDLLRTGGPCTTVAGMKFPDYGGGSFHEVPLLAYKVDDGTKGLIIHWVQQQQQHAVCPWTPAEPIKHEYEPETQQSIGSVPWISFTSGVVNRRCKQAVLNAFRSAAESYARAPSDGHRHGFYPGCAGWAEIMHNNRLILLAERAAHRGVLALEVEGRELNDPVRIRLHQLRVVFEFLDSPISGDDGGTVSEDDDRPVFEGDADKALRA